MQIEGKSALVTGGVSGLGLATVRSLVADGARVVAVDLPSADHSALHELGGAVRFAAADVTAYSKVTGPKRCLVHDMQRLTPTDVASLSRSEKP